MKKFIRIGVDLAKNSFQVQALESEGGKAVARKLSRSKFRSFFEGIEPCLVGMEACASAHYWARELMEMGHEVKLMPPSYVKPYVKRGKNDAVDAEACCEAVSRPGMRFVPVKSATQQATLTLHKTRDLLVKQRTMSINALRAHLAEFGIIVARGVGRVDELIELAARDPNLPAAALASVRALERQLEGIEASIGAVEEALEAEHAACPKSQLLDGAPGIGVIIATAAVAMTPDPNVFRTGRDYAAWMGLTPGQHSTGGKSTLGPITKKGNRYMRKLFVLAATSLIRVAPKRTGALAEWIIALLKRKPRRHVTVALANKLARSVWAMMKTGEAFRAELFARA
jgi:transposase